MSLPAGNSALRAAPTAPAAGPTDLWTRIRNRAVAAALVLVIGYVDYITGYEMTIYPFYCIPLVVLVWQGDFNGSIAMAALSAIIWWVSDRASGHIYAYEWHRAWDGVVRLMFFLVVVVVAQMMKSRGDANRAQIELLRRANRLEAEIVEISESEQRRIGRDLHDGLCQNLASLGFAAASLEKTLASRAPDCATAAAELARLLEDAVVETRDLAHGLSPVDRDQGGLESALEELANRTSKLAGIACVFIGDSPDTELTNENAIDVYRIVQESISNAIRHGRAKTITIALERAGDDLTLRVSDDGAGIDSRQPNQAGMGMNVMRYRARRIGGMLEIGSNSPTGTVVTCNFKISRHPLPP